MIHIGRRKLVTSKPDDLDEQLASQMGCSAAEAEQILSGYPIPSTIAGLLLPWLKEPVPLVDLARSIAAEGIDDARLKVLKLYQGNQRVETGKE